MRVLKSFARGDSGATAIEYGLIAAIIAIGSLAAIHGLRGTVLDMYNLVSGAVAAVSP